MASARDTAPDGNLGRRILDQYVLVEKIGEGGMGAVYLADQPTMGRRAVVKLLHAALSRDEEVKARFALEARAAAALNHPHIVTVYNHGALDDGTLFLAMEHLDGRDLEHAIEERGKLSPARAVHVARQICGALAEAHARGVIHRDLKPSNVMLVTRGRDDEFVKVLDFGIAKVRGVALTATGTVFGTPEYMSPEQLRGGKLDGRSDLYALGVVLYEMLTGRLPFDCATPEQTMAAHLELHAPRLTDVPPAVADVVARLLAKEASSRPASADETAEMLAGALDGERRSRAPLVVAGALVVAAAVATTLFVAAKPRVERAPPVSAPPTVAPPVSASPPTVAPPIVTPPTVARPAVSSAQAPTAPDTRTVDELEHEFLTMPSRLSFRDRRAALRSLAAHIDASGGTPAQRARKHRDALIELIRQHAN